MYKRTHMGGWWWWDGTSLLPHILLYSPLSSSSFWNLDLAALQVSETAKAEHLPTLARNNPMDPSPFSISLAVPFIYSHLAVMRVRVKWMCGQCQNYYITKLSKKKRWKAKVDLPPHLHYSCTRSSHLSFFSLCLN